ncbi:uncharacterized protein LOC106872953 [Octopus bimaculoides]|uniref:Uncharacterized protein n=1 Tax=Octopus bimaculoides TaxID=37653 RepID=A0A0L8H3X3_OCTBM|nr:uncharacterized protein LOC106872953 [Octopus bimaculoides]|eukprot:XP_014775619.1 PREDICTED: uncharacterized protein LOC106872953 [Octopus bimaculoides]
MATYLLDLRWLLLFLYIFTSLRCNAACIFPSWYHGEFYSYEEGKNKITNINDNNWGDYTCEDIQTFNETINKAINAKNAIILVKSKNCYSCIYVMYRTVNILQYKVTSCTASVIQIGDSAFCEIKMPQLASQLTTMYSLKPKTVSCKTTFEGMYHFTYEKEEGAGGICNSPKNVIKACQEPGSAYVDNEVFLMSYGRCQDNIYTEDKQIRYQCMGSWVNEDGYLLAGISNVVANEERERFKCLLTNKDQNPKDNKRKWVKSRFSECRTLKNIYSGHERLELVPIPPATKLVQPSCNLPRNLTGTWFHVAEFQSDVRINDTHIYFKTHIDRFTYEEQYYSCQQTLGTRFLMSKIVVGKCEIDFVCFDIQPRHHSIVRFRVGKPNRLTSNEMDSNFLMKKFRQSCTWQAFVMNRDDFNWKYDYFIFNPPTPVPCPIGGRYSFIQTGFPNEFYTTRIRGITDKPRVQVDCRNVQSEAKSCTQDMTKFEIDVEYCETVDYRGRPIGEYDEPDNILKCVGYWMEDLRSYLITYDDEDAISNFRCWVYERLSWTSLIMSRAANAKCKREQTAHSALGDGSTLRVELAESERLYDDCPQRFDHGFDPYRKPNTIYILNRSVKNEATVLAIILAFCSFLTNFSIF